MAKSQIITPPSAKLITPIVPASINKIDASKLKPLTSADLPMKAVTWFAIVEPRLPKEYAGSIQLAEETKKVEEVQTTIGTLLSKGPLFGESRTQAGLRLNDDPGFAALKEGDHVLFARYTGQRVHINVEGVRRPVILLTDSEVMAIVHGDMERIAFWI